MTICNHKGQLERRFGPGLAGNAQKRTFWWPFCIVNPIQRKFVLESSLCGILDRQNFTLHIVKETLFSKEEFQIYCDDWIWRSAAWLGSTLHWAALHRWMPPCTRDFLAIWLKEYTLCQGFRSQTPGHQPKRCSVWCAFAKRVGWGCWTDRLRVRHRMKVRFKL